MSETNLTIQLDPVALREATSQAIMGVLTPEIQHRIIQQAISLLLRPSTNSWEKGKSPIEQAFASAVEQVAREIALEYVKDNQDLMSRLRGLIAETAQKVLNTDADKMAERMAASFVASLRHSGDY